MSTKCSDEILYFSKRNTKEQQHTHKHTSWSVFTLNYLITCNRKLQPPCWAMFSVLRCYYFPYTLAVVTRIGWPYNKVSIPSFCSANCSVVSNISVKGKNNSILANPKQSKASIDSLPLLLKYSTIRSMLSQLPIHTIPGKSMHDNRADVISNHPNRYPQMKCTIFLGNILSHLANN